MDGERTNRSIEEVVGVLRRRALWIVLCVILVGGAAYGFSKRETKMYTATAALAFNTNQLDQEIAGLSAGGANSDPVAQQASNLELVRVGDMAAKTARALDHGLTAEKVLSSLSISGKGESNLVEVSATSQSPLLAAGIANTYVRQFAKEQRRSNRQFFESALMLVNRQLAALSPAQRVGTDGLNLQNRAQTLSLLAKLNYNTVQVAGEAAVPSSPSSPRTKRNAILGAIMGLLLGLGVAFLLERLDPRMREQGDLGLIYGLPVLGEVPNSAALVRSAKRDGGVGATLPAAVAEAFNLIRAHLRFFNVEREVRTILIASPAPGDGKTTIARHLAEASARSGSRVLLLELDLRNPTLARQLGLQSGPGLTGVLIGAISVDEAIQSVALVTPSLEGTTDRALDVLVAGDVPPNAGELLESRAMEAVLARAKSAYDLVVIDTPPLAAVSDAFAVLTKVDGVVIVGRIGHSRRDAAARLQEVLAGNHVSLLGVVINGVKAARAGSSYSAPSVNTSFPASVSPDAPASEEFVPTARS
jgi:capsular exopolysaccharide synthesis family protein